MHLKFRSCALRRTNVEQYPLLILCYTSSSFSVSFNTIVPQFLIFYDNGHDILRPEIGTVEARHALFGELWYLHGFSSAKNSPVCCALQICVEFIIMERFSVAYYVDFKSNIYTLLVRKADL